MVNMLAAFHGASGIPAPFDAGATGGFVAALLNRDDAALIVADAGVIGGVIVPAWCAPQWRIAVELFWWAGRDGLALLRAFETWAHEAGAQEIRMSTLTALPRADGILRRKGYAATETSHAKVI